MKKIADPAREYVLIQDFPPWAKTPDKVLVPQDTVVVNVNYKYTPSTLSRVILGGDAELEFTVKKTGEKYTTNYGWLFVENTPSSLARLQAYREAIIEYKSAKKAMHTAFHKLRRVAGPSDGVFGPPSEKTENVHND